MKSFLCAPLASWVWVATLQIPSFCAAFTTSNNARMIFSPSILASPQQPYLWKQASSLVHRPTGMLIVPHHHSNLPLMRLSMSSENKGDDMAPSTTKQEVSRFKKIRQIIFPPKKDADGLTTSQKLAKMGLSVLLSYGFVSNMSYSVTVSLAWFIFSKRTGMSPLAPGQWKSFLAVYAGFYIFNNIIRPVRVGLSMGVARYFDNVVAFFQDKFKVKKGVAVGITVFFANIVGTCSAMSAGIFLASMASGVPIWAK